MPRHVEPCFSHMIVTEIAMYQVGSAPVRRPNRCARTAWTEEVLCTYVQMRIRALRGVSSFDLLSSLLEFGFIARGRDAKPRASPSW